MNLDPTNSTINRADNQFVPNEILPWQQMPWTRFAERCVAGTVPHAILLHGPAGTGKNRFAWALTRRLLCREPVDGAACRRCPSCKLAHPGGAHPDLSYIAPGDGRQQILVEQIRDLSAALQLAPSFGGRRVALLVKADSMNRNAANALLKTLEEPGPDSHLVLLADRLDRLPATILSRCQKTHLATPPPDEAKAWLAAECLDTAAGERELALELAGGAPLAAQMLLAEHIPQAASQLATDLDALAVGKADLAALQGAWSKLPAARLWAIIGYWLHRCAVDKVKEKWPAPMLPNLLTMYQAAVRHYQLTSTPVRHDLQIWDWLLQWSQVRNSG